jgi:2-dehydropantoate 2-reductase
MEPTIETKERADRSRFLVVGCGAIGGIVAAHLFELGHEVVATTTNAGIAEAVNARGFQLRGEGGARGVAGKMRVGLPELEEGPFDFIILGVQPPALEEAARGAVHLLAANGDMVCLQNGLCEARVAAIAGEERTLGAIVGWGAAMPEPGVYDRTAAGGFTLGRLSRFSPSSPSRSSTEQDARARTLAQALEPIGPVEMTTNLEGKRWSKLAINCAISSLGALGGDRLGALLQHRVARRIALEIMTEAVHVARAESVRLEKVSGTLDLDWIALTEEERARAGSPGLVAKHALLLAVGFRFRRMRSSMLAAIERGRTPAVDFLNGEIVARGKARRIPTPMNARIQNVVWEIARGKLAPGLDLLRRLGDGLEA